MSAITVINSIFSTIGTILFYGWIPFLIIGLYALKKRWERFPLEAVIYEKKGDNLIKTNDRIGKRFEKDTGITYSQFLVSKDTVPMLNYDCILHTANKHTNFIEKFINLLRPTAGTVFFFRYGSKQYKPIKNKFNEDGLKLTQLKDKDGQSIFQYMYQQFDPRISIGCLEFEVVDWDNMNFMVQEQRSSIVRRAKRGEFWAKTLIPLIIIGACVVIGIFILKFSADAGANLSATKPAASPEEGGSKIIGGMTNAFTPGE